MTLFFGEVFSSGTGLGSSLAWEVHIDADVDTDTGNIGELVEGGVESAMDCTGVTPIESKEGNTGAEGTNFLSMFRSFWLRKA